MVRLRNGLPPGTQGIIEATHVENPTWHVNSVVLFICGACGAFGGGEGQYRSDELQSLVTHEYGHGIGLGHTAVAASVMHNPRIVNSVPSGHDGDELDVMYSSHDDTVYGGQRLDINEYVLSPSRGPYAIMQGDGNFVIYGASVVRATDTMGVRVNGLLANRAEMQTDGNFVLLTADGGVICATRTNGWFDSIARVQNDGNFVIVSPGNNVRWSLFSQPCYLYG